MKCSYFFVILFFALSCIHKKEKANQNIDASVIKDVWKLDRTSANLDSNYYMFYFFNNDTVLIVSNNMIQKAKYILFKDSLIVGDKNYFMEKREDNLIELSFDKNIFIFQKKSLMSVFTESLIFNRQIFYSRDSNELKIEHELKVK